MVIDASSSLQSSYAPRALRARGRYLQRRLRRSRMPRVGGVLQPVQYFKRSTYQTNWVLNDTINNTFKSLEFYLSSVPNHTEFTSLYDQYCIKKVVFTLIPKFNVNTLTDIVPRYGLCWIMTARSRQIKMVCYNTRIYIPQEVKLGTREF